jgi:hypothetical protein
VREKDIGKSLKILKSSKKKNEKTAVAALTVGDYTIKLLYSAKKYYNIGQSTKLDFVQSWICRSTQTVLLKL